MSCRRLILMATLVGLVVPGAIAGESKIDKKLAKKAPCAGPASSMLLQKPNTQGLLMTARFLVNSFLRENSEFRRPTSV